MIYMRCGLRKLLQFVCVCFCSSRLSERAGRSKVFRGRKLPDAAEAAGDDVGERINQSGWQVSSRQAAVASAAAAAKMSSSRPTISRSRRLRAGCLYSSQQSGSERKNPSELTADLCIFGLNFFTHTRAPALSFFLLASTSASSLQIDPQSFEASSCRRLRELTACFTEHF